MERNSFTLPAAILGAALIVTGAIATYGFFEVKTLADTISVTGSAEMNIESDVIKWNVEIVHSVDLNGLQQGNEAMQRDLESLRAFLKDQGVEDTSVLCSRTSSRRCTIIREGECQAGIRSGRP